jgi:WD40 repeat protein/serine/threonine protein kinase
MSACATPDVLEQLLRGSLPEEQADRLGEHLVGCAPCRALLERLSERPVLQHWASAYRSFRSPAADEPGLATLLAKLSSGSPANLRASGEPVAPADTSLRFLATPEREGDLGKLGPYRVVEELGRGGMGIVLRAYDEELRRTVALKVLPPERADARARARFVREARAAAGLSHENVVPVHAVANPPDGPPYFVMPYVEGPTLRQRIKAIGRLSPAEAARIAEQMAEGLAAAHRAGLVHRDIKPANVILDTASGQAKITDFGLVRVAALPGGTTQDGAVRGTPEYMSPEQVRTPDRIDARSDLYSLGVTLYEALTGNVPFHGVAHMVLQQILNDEPRPPRRLNDSIPRDLETICLKCLQKEPAKRYTRASDLADDLRRFLAGKPIQARPIRVWERVVKWARRRPAAAALLTVSSLASVLLVAGLVVGIGREKEARQEIDRAYQRERQISYLNAIADAEHEIAAKNWGRADELLEECPEKLRGWEWHYLKRLRHTSPISPLPMGEQIVMGGGFDLAFHPDGRLLAIPSRDNIQVCDPSSGREVWTLGGHTGRVLGVAFSPDGHRLASTSEDKTVKVWDIATGRELLHLCGHKERVIGVAFSPDGQRLASASGETDRRGQVKVWDAASGQLLFSFPGQAVPVSSLLVHLAFSPDGRRLASGSVDNSVKVWNLTTSQEVHTLSGHTKPILHVTFSPNGRRLISAGRDRRVNVWDLGDGDRRELAPSWSLRDFSLSVWAMALSSDGGRLAIGGPSADGNVRVYDLTTRKLLHTLRGDTRVVSVAFSPDGRRLASAGYDRIVRLWDTATGHEVLALRGHADLVGRVLFSPDGQRLASASADGTVRVWDASPFDENANPTIRTISGHDGEFFGVAFSPDSQLLASASTDGAIKLWDAQTGQEVHAFHGHKEAALCVAFSPDGQRLLSGSMDKTARLWDARTGEELVICDDSNFETLVRGVAFSPDGKAFATGSHQKLQLWDAESGRRLFARQADRGIVFAVAFSPDGRRLATVGLQGTAKVWNVTGEEVCSFKGHKTSFYCVAFHPTGKYLASGDSDNEVKLWDPAIGEPIHDSLSGHTDYVYGVAFSPDGRYLATASWKEVIVWDADSFEQLQTFDRLAGRIWCVAFSPDGKRLAAASGYKGRGEIKIWDASLWEKCP